MSLGWKTKKWKKIGKAIVIDASYGFHSLPIPDYQPHVLLGCHHFFDPRHFVYDYHCHYWSFCDYHDCHVHFGCGSFEGNAILIDCGISSSMCGSIPNYKIDYGYGRVDLYGLGDFSNDFYLDSCCNHIPLGEVGPVDPFGDLDGPWDYYHAPTALVAWFDCVDET